VSVRTFPETATEEGKTRLNVGGTIPQTAAWMEKACRDRLTFSDFFYFLAAMR
jgi:hypothetical protein